MKQIWPLLCLVLIATPLAAPATALAEGLTLRGGMDEAVVLLASDKKDRDDRRNSGSNRQRGADDRSRQSDTRQRDTRQGDDSQARDRQPQAQHFDRGNTRQVQENRDDRINRAMSVAGRRGRVLDAGPQGGSVFWVRVATDHGRVDLLVDADSGRIIGER
jgi:hypothetical protein